MLRWKQIAKQYGVLWFAWYWGTFLPLFAVFTIPYHCGFDLVGLGDYLERHGWLEWLKWFNINIRNLIDRCNEKDTFVIFDSFMDGNYVSNRLIWVYRGRFLIDFGRLGSIWGRLWSIFDRFRSTFVDFWSILSRFRSTSDRFLVGLGRFRSLFPIYDVIFQKIEFNGETASMIFSTFIVWELCKPLRYGFYLYMCRATVAFCRKRNIMPKFFSKF